MIGYECLPNATDLGNGIFIGVMAGHCFTYNGIQYYSEVGLKGRSSRVKLVIKDNKVEGLILKYD